MLAGRIKLRSFLAIIVGISYHLLVNRSRFGFDLRASGYNPIAARVGGVPPKRMILIAMLLSGAVAGLVGMVDILSRQHRYDQNFTPNLGFAGIAPPSLRLYPIETHIAEKLHAYTLPRKRPNTRVKDLPDVALLAGVREIDSVRLRRALEQTFTSRKTHPLPAALPLPPTAWMAPYARMVEEDELRWADLAMLTRAVEAFMNPVLDGTALPTWSPTAWRWGT